MVSPLGPMRPDVLGAYLLTHMLGHGYDLARALGHAHMIDRERVRLTLPFMLTAMPRVTDASGTAGPSVRYAIRLWGGGRFDVLWPGAPYRSASDCRGARTAPHSSSRPPFS
ncbi:hypothetical protein [Streptomyces sp. NPDC055134]